MIRIAVADDHEGVRKSLADILDAYGFEVVATCANGEDAITACRDHALDVMVMDIRMPVVDGVAATREIKRIQPEVGVLLVTAYEEDGLHEAGLAAGADAVELKGTSASEIARRIREVAGCPAG